MDILTPLYFALEESKYTYSNMGADYSVTDLIKPTKVTLLTQRHKHELPEDSNATTQVQSIIGTGTHRQLDYLTRRYAARNGGLIELRTEIRLWDKFLGRKVTGQFDGWLSMNGEALMYDYKVCKTWKLIFADYEDWERQLNLYTYMGALVGMETTQAGIIAVLKDWQQGKIYEKDYPKENYIGVPIPLWTFEEQERFLFERLQTLIDNEPLLDEELPDCTPKEMWETEEKFAIMEPKKSKATRLCSSEEDVERYLKWRKDHGKEIPKYKIEHRPATRKRCAEYCNLKQWCPQWQAYNGQQ